MLVLRHEENADFKIYNYPWYQQFSRFQTQHYRRSPCCIMAKVAGLLLRNELVQTRHFITLTFGLIHSGKV